MRRVLACVLLVGAVVSLPGCVVSLFSDSKVAPDGAARIERLEQRMDRVEEVLNTRAPN